MASSSGLMRVRTRVLWSGGGVRCYQGNRSRVNTFYLLLLVSLTLCPGIRTLPFFSQTRCGSGTPWARQVNTALPPAGLDTDCGH